MSTIEVGICMYYREMKLNKFEFKQLLEIFKLKLVLSTKI